MIYLGITCSESFANVITINENVLLPVKMPRESNLLYGESRISGTERDIESDNQCNCLSLPKEFYGRFPSRREDERNALSAGQASFTTSSLHNSHSTDVQAFLLI